MKKILIIAVVLLSIFFIYLNTIDRKVYYLALGDFLAVGIDENGRATKGYSDYIKDYFKSKNLLEQYVNDYAEKEYRSTDLERDIIDNKEIIIDNKKITLKNALIKSDLVTLSIGMNDFYYYFDSDRTDLYNLVDEAMDDIENLFKIMRQYCKESIVVMGYYGVDSKYDDIIIYANKKLKELCKQYKMEYVDVFALFKNNSYLTKLYPSNEGYQALSKVIIDTIDKSLFK